MMHMTFYWSREVTVLFSSWKTDSWLSYSLTLLACIVVGAFYQYVDHIRIRMRRAVKPNQTASLEDPLIPEQKSAKNKWSATRIAAGVLFGFSSGLGYLLMLAVMSFNGGVFLAIVLGLTVGYLAFRTDDDDDDESAGGANSTCACA